jgi:hypothetical protein
MPRRKQRIKTRTKQSRTLSKWTIIISNKICVSNLTGDANKTYRMAFVPSKTGFEKEISLPNDWLVRSSLK